MFKKIPKTYNSQKVERRIYSLWEKSGLFNPDRIKSSSHYSNILPPPNANGELHLGHASGYSVMDIFGRFERMKGKKVLLLPGKDHAGISTQAVYEKKLMNERGTTRQKLGRKRFYKEVYNFCLTMSDYMREQEKKMGLSADWSREKFTLEPKISRAVLETFVKMHKDGLIYKGKRIINWCPRCGSALSDLEVIHFEREGHFYYIKYPLYKSNDFITVATTRPETMLGDTAVAVNPSDKRYQTMVGKRVILPLLNRLIPIITDKRVDQKFGTGAVKITPAHDSLDWEIGRDHNLSEIQVIDEKAVITALGGKYEGLDVEKARAAIIKDLERNNFLEKIETIRHSVSQCERCQTTIEPLISDQWFVNVDHPQISLKKMAIRAIKNGEIKIYPPGFEKILIRWFSDLRDWCISRQIWWGHRFPVYYREKSKGGRETYVGVNSPKGKGWVQDESTFDTWFSSGQWVYTTLGYPRERDYRKFYPTDMMVMGRDILFFWSARMIMMSLYRTGKIPFKNLYFTGLIRDKEGRKMSKSRGNGIDPLAIIRNYGSDALRLSLIVNTTPGLDMRVYPEKIESFRNFVNKLWNIARYCFSVNPNFCLRENLSINELKTNADHWIMKKTLETIRETTKHLEAKRISMAAEKLKFFTWNIFADWYVEVHKIEKNDIVLGFVLDKILKLWHPYAPFVTEEIFQLFGTKKILMGMPWPQTTEKNYQNKKAIQFETIVEIVSQIRKIRAVYKLASQNKMEAGFMSSDKNISNSDYEVIKKLSGLQKINFYSLSPEKLSRAIFTVKKSKFFVVFDKSFDVKKEKIRILKEINDLKKYASSLRQKLTQQNFLEKAPPAVVAREKEKLEKTLKKIKEAELIVMA